MYAWVVTGSLLFGSPPRRVRGCLRPPLLCQLRFDVLAVFRCACVIAHWGRYLSRHNRTKSRLCRQCYFPPWDPTWIVLVVVCLSYSLVWWSIMSSGKLSAMDQAGASPTPSTPLHAFLEDATSLRWRHRRCAQDLATRMSRTSLRDTEDRTADVSPRPKVTRRSVSRARRPHRPVRGRLFQDHGIGSPSSFGSNHCTSSDGIGASSI